MRRIIRTWPIHPIAAALPRSDGDYRAMLASLRAHGQRDPVLLFRGQIIDGVLRMRACQALGRECRVREYQGDDPVAFAAAHNRRIAALPRGERSLLAKRIRQIYCQDKRRWIAQARAEFAPGPRKCCAICRHYADVAHAHHTTPLHMQYDAGVERPDQAFVWLCPTHHYAVHQMLDGSGDLAGFEPRERRAVAKVVGLAADFISHTVPGVSRKRA
jgi:hypothetical protein